MKPPFQIFGTDHVRLIVGNAKQAAHYYQTVFGFEPVAYRGLETGDREKASYMLQQNKIRLVLSSPYRANSPMNVHLMLHGDGVRDVAFWVDDATAAWEYTTQNGAVSHQKPTEYSDDNGKVVLSSIHTYGDTLHTFVERKDYDGVFLPGFMPYKTAVKTSDVGLNFIDHFVGNQPEGEMQKVASWYENVLGFHRFWSVDDKDISTEHTALRSIVVSSENERIKMPINRPAQGMKKSQIQEFVEYYTGPGVQHIALDTKDIVRTVSMLRENGVEFLETPATYYDMLQDRVGKIDENIAKLAEYGILVDADQHGYLLQIFTKPVQDRPTLFFEVIQRKGCSGFGKGNFKALFEAIEREQDRRGNL
ncbi:MAG: 4-hydroxyphenylpyruvate dioxygenase [Calditrichia bacterium]|nr:4-hydroxyphenylpyruvate dioxygenase [Calditrichota bacterium]MCB0268023.1 4-hydroxyphenylpyruvate dioxygenase [Calditrichota bacterium]MCB9067732.1 4-hydroxyphenylpyruvate dioxygenase [Calditrichia bacterium]